MLFLFCWKYVLPVAWTSLIIVEHELHRSPVQHEFLPKWNRRICVVVYWPGYWSFRKQNQCIQTQKWSQHIHMFISLTDLWGKITIGVTTCLSDLQTLLCYVANSRKCTAQMKGNYCFADNLLERTGGIHMLVRCITLKCPKLASFFPALLAAFFPKHNYTERFISSFPRHGYTFSIWKSCY